MGIVAHPYGIASHIFNFLRAPAVPYCGGHGSTQTASIVMDADSFIRVFVPFENSVSVKTDTAESDAACVNPVSYSAVSFRSTLTGQVDPGFKVYNSGESGDHRTGAVTSREASACIRYRQEAHIDEASPAPGSSQKGWLRPALPVFHWRKRPSYPVLKSLNVTVARTSCKVSFLSHRMHERPLFQGIPQVFQTPRCKGTICTGSCTRSCTFRVIPEPVNQREPQYPCGPHRHR